MTKHPRWQYDELIQLGRDYADPAEVAIYDKRHAQFRDVEGDNRAILDAIGLESDQALLEIGSGTGALAIQAARRCTKVYAADVSEAMLEYSKQKAEAAGVTNIEFIHGGFLTYDHADEPVDAIVTCVALHHLPDFWKCVGLRRVNRMLKPGGMLYISDVVFGSDDPLGSAEDWIEKLAAVGGADLRRDAEKHVREEHSTLDWIMDGMLERTGSESTARLAMKAL